MTLPRAGNEPARLALEFLETVVSVVRLTTLMILTIDEYVIPPSRTRLQATDAATSHSLSSASGPAAGITSISVQIDLLSSAFQRSKTPALAASFRSRRADERSRPPFGHVSLPTSRRCRRLPGFGLSSAMSQREIS